MTARFFIVLLSILATCSAFGGKPTRILMHTFQEGSAIVFVAIVDQASGPRGTVRSNDPARQRAFTVSRQQFDQMWRTLESGGLQKYGAGKGASRVFDAIDNFVFSTGYMPNGKKTNYVIPKNRASGPIAALARQLEAHAR